MAFLLFFAFGAAAQERFTWKGLRFETSTIQDTIDALGKPKKNKIENVKVVKTISPNAGAKMDFRKLEYENINEFDEVYLLFLNEKLFSLELNPKKKKSMLAADLGKIYSADFLYMEGLPKELDFAAYEGQKETTVPKVYSGGFYYMISVKPDIAILATINNNSWKAIWRDGVKKPTVEMFPGFVSKIQIFTRSFEGK